MYSFDHAYKKMCAAVLSPYGFTKYRKTFFRVINDVYQTITYERVGRAPYGRGVRVSFALNPLCEEKREPRYYFDGSIYYLRAFEASSEWEIDRWYCSETKESIDACVREIERFVTGYLLPLFESADCCKNALPILVDYEWQIHAIRQGQNKYQGPRKAEDLTGIYWPLDSAKYYMALKIGDFDLALRLRSLLLRQNEISLEKSRARISPEQYEIRRIDLQHLKDEIERLRIGDRAYFEKLLEDNEAYTRMIFQRRMR